ncbi:MAG: hypothetical protein VX527_01145 [Planctomycetota bacterium]|nr:hypothetical protein [Planctomycetota bacterium]
MNASVPPPPMTIPSPGQQHHVWPTVIGVIGIILAAIGLISAILYFLISPDLIASLMPERQREDFEMKIARTPLNVTLTVVGIFLNLLLLWGSILLLRRRVSSRSILNIFAILTIIFTIVSVTLMMVSQFNVDEEIAIQKSRNVLQSERAETGQALPPKEEAELLERSSRETEQVRVERTVKNIGSAFGGICGGLFELAWPIIVLCFMNGSRKRATINSWA